MSITTSSTSSSMMQSQSSAESGISDVEKTKNQFLQLLITQLKYQDPLSPADSSQFTAQMMSMGQLEQLFDLNQNMASLAASQQGSMIAQYAGMVGKQALASGNLFQVDGTNRGSMQFKIDKIPASTAVNVFDGYGNLVRQFNINVTQTGEQVVYFDGKNSQGNDLADGYYSFQVQALAPTGEGIPTTTYSTGAISSIRLDNGSPVFQMGDNDLGLIDIYKIY